MQHCNQNEWLAQFPFGDRRMVYFRHVRPEDEQLITDAIRTASRETLLHRFFSPIRHVAPDLLRRLLAIDRVKETCVVGVVEEHGQTRIICGARYVRLPEPAAAEMALTVHDDFQRRGLGTFLFTLLCKMARQDGIRQLEAYVMASNIGMLHLLRKVVPERAGRYLVGDVYHVVINLDSVQCQDSSQYQ
jgi:acetyltransferase